MQDILDILDEKFSSGGNIAFFCRFSRDDASIGEASLFLGGKAFSFRDHIAQDETKFLADAMYGDLTVPVVIPYDFVTSVFPKSNVRRSEFPLLMGFIPDEEIRGSFTRKSSDLPVRNIPYSRDMDFEESVRECRDRIIRGELLQVVLSREMRTSGLDFPEIVRGFLERDRSLYVFLYRIGDFTIAGSSPENLITVDGKEAEIYPIAGTVGRGKNSLEDDSLARKLLESEKDKLEHRMLVDLARNDLGKISRDGSVRVTESMKLRKYASVQHLVSKVESIISDDVGPMDILRAVFPAGTVSGAPKRRAVEIIDRYERAPRGAYAGALGTMGSGRMDLSLLIRSVFRTKLREYTQAGAGIVKDSVPEMEGMEVISKAMTVIGGYKSECVDN